MTHTQNLAHLVELCSYRRVRTRSWTWLLGFTKLLTCLALITSLWGCGTPYVIMPSASELPSSTQMQMEAERDAIPNELRALLKQTITTQPCRAADQKRPDPRYVGQTSPTTLDGMQLKLLSTAALWVLQVSRDPSPKRLEHRKKLLLPEPGTLPALPAIDPEKPFWDEERQEYTKGFVFGVGSGAVPLVPTAIDVGIQVKLLPKGTYWARVGRACGEIAVGTGEIILGCAGIGVGAGMSGTGGGAPAGIVVLSGSIPLVANGCVTAWHGAKDLVQLSREGEPLSETLPAQAAPQPAPPPAAPAKPAPPVQPVQAAKPVQPAKPAQAAPVETTTTTYDRTTRVTTTTKASGTTTETRPRVKGKPAGDAPKDVAKPRGGENPAAARGRQVHEEFKEKVKAKKPQGWDPTPTLYDKKTGKKLHPDALTPNGNPIELKPNTPSGREAGKRQMKKYEEAANGKKGRVIYYDP